MLTSITKLIVAATLSLLAASCISFPNQVNGKGNVETKTFALSTPIDHLEISHGWEVELIKSSENRIDLKANENLIPHFKFKEKDGGLSISSDKNIGSASSKKVTIYYSTTLTRLKVSSGSELSSKDTFNQQELSIDASSGAEAELTLKTKATNVKASSGAEVNLQGTAINLFVDASSGAEINAKQLETKSTNAEASSGASIEVYTEEELTAKASSGGEINYYGNPKKTDYNKGLSGDIQKN